MSYTLYIELYLDAQRSWVSLCLLLCEAPFRSEQRSHINALIWLRSNQLCNELSQRSQLKTEAPPTWNSSQSIPWCSVSSGDTYWSFFTDRELDTGFTDSLCYSISVNMSTFLPRTSVMLVCYWLSAFRKAFLHYKPGCLAPTFRRQLFKVKNIDLIIQIYYNGEGRANKVPKKSLCRSRGNVAHMFISVPITCRAKSNCKHETKTCTQLPCPRYL